MTEDDVGFMIAPRINAASRIDHPNSAFKIFSLEDDAKVQRAVDYIEEINNERKKQVTQITRTVHKKLKTKL